MLPTTGAATNQTRKGIVNSEKYNQVRPKKQMEHSGQTSTNATKTASAQSEPRNSIQSPGSFTIARLPFREMVEGGLMIAIITHDFTATQKVGEPVKYADHLTTEQAIAHVTGNLEKVPAQVRPIAEWAMTSPCRKVLLKKGGIGEEWFTAVPVATEAARAELAPFGTVDEFGYFYFDYSAKMDALEWIKARADKAAPGFTKRNGHHYAVDLADLGTVIVEKPKRASNLKPWIVRYRLPAIGPAQPYFLANHTIPFGDEK